MNNVDHKGRSDQVTILEFSITVKLKCKPDRMHIHGASLKMFSGTLTTKNDKIVSCERKFFHVYEFDVEMLYNECGMQKAVRVYCSLEFLSNYSILILKFFFSNSPPNVLLSFPSFIFR